MPPLSPEIDGRIERLLGSPVVAAHVPSGGFSDAGRWRIELATGQKAFAKLGTQPDTARWLRREHEVYARLGLRCMPALLAFDEQDGPALLLLEDLGGGESAPPWTAERVAAVHAALQVLGEVDERDLGFLPHIEKLPGWESVAEDPAPLLALQLVTDRWLQAHLPVLLQAERGMDPTGSCLLHLDVRSDNLFFVDGQVRLFDWNYAAIGRPEVDLGFWAPSLALQGGPQPHELLPNQPELASWVSGFFGARAGLPPIPRARGVRALQRRQFGQALAWAVRELDLAPPDGTLPLAPETD